METTGATGAPTLGQRLRLVRVELCLSMDRVEELTGIDASTLSMYENDRRDPSRRRLEALADLYHVSVDWLLGRTEYRTGLVYTPGEVREAAATYAIRENDPRVLEIARQLRGLASCPDILENVITYARFLAEQERRHPGPRTPGPLPADEQNPAKDGKTRQD